MIHYVFNGVFFSPYSFITRSIILSCLALVFVLKIVEANASTSLQKGMDLARRGDYAAAYREWLPLAQQGNARAQYYIGWVFDNGRGVGQSYENAVTWYRKAAEQGNPPALNNLALAYNDGRGVKKDHVEAIKWFSKAAYKGNAKAQYNLGLIYGNENSTLKDYKEAAKWYRKAAEQEHMSAQFNLGILYATGQGTEKDNVYAHMWLNIAASQGDLDAVKVRDLVAKRMTSEDIRKAQKLAHRCVQKKLVAC